MPSAFVWAIGIDIFTGSEFLYFIGNGKDEQTCFCSGEIFADFNVT